MRVKLQVGHRMGQEGARWAPKRIRQAQVGPKMRQEEGKMGTKEGQEGATEGPVGPKSGQKKGTPNLTMRPVLEAFLGFLAVF